MNPISILRTIHPSFIRSLIVAVINLAVISTAIFLITSIQQNDPADLDKLYGYFRPVIDAMSPYVPALSRHASYLHRNGFFDLAKMLRMIIALAWIVSTLSIALLLGLAFRSLVRSLSEKPLPYANIRPAHPPADFSMVTNTLMVIPALILQYPAILILWAGGSGSFGAFSLPFSPQLEPGHLYLVGLYLSIAVFGFGFLTLFSDSRRSRPA